MYLHSFFLLFQFILFGYHHRRMKEFQFPQIFKAVIGEYFPIDQSESKIPLKVPSAPLVRSLKNGCLTVIGNNNYSKDFEESERKSNRKQRQFRKQNKLLTTANPSSFSIRKTIQKGRNNTSNIRQQSNINNNSIEQSQGNQSSRYFLSRRATRMMNRISIMKNLPTNDRKSSFLNVVNEPTIISTSKFKENDIEQSNSQIRVNTRENIKKGSRLIINRSKNQFRLQTENKIRQSKKHTSNFLELVNANKQSSQEKDTKTNNNIKQSDFLNQSKKDQSNYATPAYSRHMKAMKKTKIGTKILQQQEKIIKPQKKKAYKNQLMRNKSMKIVNFSPLQPKYFSERQIFSYQSSEISLIEENHHQQLQQKNLQNGELRIKKTNQIHRISDELAYQFDKNGKANNFLYKSRKIIEATRHNIFSAKKLNTQFYSNNLCNRNSFNSKYANIYTQINDFLVNRASNLSQNTISKNLNSQTVIFYERKHQDNFAAKRILATQRENLIMDYGLKFMYKMHMLKQKKL